MRLVPQTVALLAIFAISVCAPPPTGPFVRVTAFLSEHDLDAAYGTHPENVARPQPLRPQQHGTGANSANYPRFSTVESYNAFSHNSPSRFTPFRTIDVLNRESPSSSAALTPVEQGLAPVVEGSAPAERVHLDPVPPRRQDFQFERVHSSQAEAGMIKLPNKFVYARATWLDPVYESLLISLLSPWAPRLKAETLRGLEIPDATAAKIVSKQKHLFQASQDAYVWRIPAYFLQQAHIYRPIEVIVRHHSRLTRDVEGDLYNVVTFWSTVNGGSSLALLRIYHINPQSWESFRLYADGVERFGIGGGAKSWMASEFYLTRIPRDEH